jgi:hypothetical protein
VIIAVIPGAIMVGINAGVRADRRLARKVFSRVYPTKERVEIGRKKRDAGCASSQRRLFVHSLVEADLMLTQA